VLRLVTDENFDGRILRGLMTRLPDLDVVRAQDAGLTGSSDRELLEWAAQEGRVLLTHDRRTMTGFAIERVRAGQTLAGVVVVSRWMSVGDALRDVELLIGASEPEELRQQLLYLPL
jgi:hypothetical protein